MSDRTFALTLYLGFKCAMYDRNLSKKKGAIIAPFFVIAVLLILFNDLTILQRSFMFRVQP
jgi:hypothetical protein